MILRVLYCGLLLSLVALLLGCAATPTAVPAVTPPPAATSGPAPTRTIGSIPAQPTSLPIATKAAVPFQSPTPAPRVGQTVTASTPASVAPASPAATTAAVAPAQPAPSSAGPIPTAVGVATGRRSEIKLAFLAPLKPGEEAEPPELVNLRGELKKVNGFLEISGDEEKVTVGYDGGLVTAEQLIQKFADLKYPVRRQ